MKKLMLLVLMGVTLSACANTQKVPQVAQKLNEIAPYPNAKVGATRYVIHLPSLKDEANAKVEILVGKDMNVDCNAHNLGGVIKEKELKGWGYSYYEVEEVKGTLSTMMACPESANKNQFVTIRHNLGLLNYNSQLPLVFYVPNDVTVRYRIWQPDSKVLQATAE
ncbi:serine protease inhibitor ecotin [Gilliamella sp. ESL0443]|uniref:serine protease inhibitor ecotin n=1 Tax=Gilliamella sp. ESL0443 TaxID=2704655 RepID=UPI001C6A6969|nr:serine protease inhibitor ecotin [Gilliamella sp. ESL0443]QYN42266.1 serine protease inhibitor ecotin [Gilliamella sp. ESL0443]